MTELERIKNYFPVEFRENVSFQKHIIKEYIQLLILDFLSSSKFTRKIVFIGGTNLRLVKGIDRFSEDLDFDCKGFTREEFTEMANAVLQFLNHAGYPAESRPPTNDRLKAFRQNIYFPGLLYNMRLTGHKEERFLIKLECQDQRISYNAVTVNIKGCGFFFPFPVPSDGVMCSMKISAMLSRQKGRDFYDVMFLLQQTGPDYRFLADRLNIHNREELNAATGKILKTTDLNLKKRDFEHLLFNKKNSSRILSFDEFFREMI